MRAADVDMVHVDPAADVVDADCIATVAVISDCEAFGEKPPRADVDSRVETVTVPTVMVRAVVVVTYASQVEPWYVVLSPDPQVKVE